MGESWGETWSRLAFLERISLQVSPKIHPPKVKHELRINYIKNKNYYSLYYVFIHLSPTPLATRIFACARGGWVKGESWTTGSPHSSRHVGSRSKVSAKAVVTADHKQKRDLRKDAKGGHVFKWVLPRRLCGDPAGNDPQVTQSWFRLSGFSPRWRFCSER
jgi:hypothetical protein